MQQTILKACRFKMFGHTSEVIKLLTKYKSWKNDIRDTNFLYRHILLKNMDM